MSQSLDLPDSVFDALQQAASASGTTPVGWIATHLPSEAPAFEKGGAKTCADLFAGRIGRFHSGGGKDALSQNCGDRFTDYPEEKRYEGRL